MLPGKHAVILVYSTSYAIRAEKILHHVDCSVMTVKPDGFVTPVRLDE